MKTILLLWYNKYIRAIIIYKKRYLLFEERDKNDKYYQRFYS